ncbi:MAG: hypothetical protein WC957_03370 [Candidatus Neomarinimicrobiota bacterium]
MNFNNIIRAALIFIVAIVISGNLYDCERELELVKFIDDYRSYKPEVRIEAILAPIQICDAEPCYQVIVRVDNSITIDDTTIFNGRDDNGNWRSYTDENGNGRYDFGEPLNDDLGRDGIAGQKDGFPARDKGEGNGKPDYGEPNVDEYDEILPLIHDSTAIVSLTNLNQQKTYPLVWKNIAANFQYLGRISDDKKENVYFSAYGGYVATANVIGLADTNDVFEFCVELPGRNLTVKGQTQLIPPADILNPGFPRVQDTLYIPYGAPGGIMWRSNPRSNVYNVRVDTVVSTSSGLEHLLVYEHPNFANRDLTAANGGIPVGFEPLTAELVPGLYRFIVTTLDENYGRYYFTSLPLKDPKNSNLRDQDGNVIIGIAGAMAATAIYFRILPNAGAKR